MAGAMILAALLAGVDPQEELKWLRLDVARTMALQDGKLVLVYVACDPGSGKMG